MFGGNSMKKGIDCDHHTDGETQKACVALVPIFNHLSAEQMDEVMEVVQSRAFKKGEMMYRATDDSDSLYIVHRGQIKIYRLSESGREQLVRILNPGDFTGELALFKEAEHEAYAEAMSESKVCMIHRDDLQRLLLKYPTIALEVLTEFSHRLETAEKQTASIATEKVDTRLALFLVECLPPGEGRKIELPMSRKDLASYLGTTPETISRKLTEFEAAGFITQQGQRKITVLDADGLLLI